MDFAITLPFWRDFEATIDRRGKSTAQILKNAEPTTFERFSLIASMWLPSVQVSLMDGQFAFAACKLHGFYIFLRAHQHHKPALLEAVLDQARALEFVMAFVHSHPEAGARFDAELDFVNNGSRYAELLVYLAIAPEHFTADEVESLFIRLDTATFCETWKAAAQ
ncbi:hypothetical protein [Bradyrhizobium sp. 153]|uniref:hypothetical protein n=1 Tax=Bradyrhizobium sp. 153 TaxID=2782627 RepID=UPI001FF752BF|nr:hypothetical protein [Bradyrhizobium sp. 153]MCK1668637.1 hypothetical protein [Bradyrhizobium sp. 153]